MDRIEWRAIKVSIQLENTKSGFPRHQLEWILFDERKLRRPNPLPLHMAVMAIELEERQPRDDRARPGLPWKSVSAPLARLSDI